MTPAIKTLQALAIDHRILHYEIDSTAADDEHNLGMAAARAMGLDSAQVFKTYRRYQPVRTPTINPDISRATSARLRRDLRKRR
jgi:hypothetical protein